MKELRCSKCNKLLAKFEGDIEVKCPRCKTINSDSKIKGFIPRNIVKECLDRVTKEKCYFFATGDCKYNCGACKHND